MQFSQGAICFTRTTSRCVPMLPDDITTMATHHGMPTSLIPPYAGDRAAVARAIEQTRSQVSRTGILLRPIRTTHALVLYAIISETKHTSLEELSHAQEAKLRWDAEHTDGAHITGEHPVARQADALYQGLRGRIVASDWTDTICTYLKQKCDAQPLREDGRNFWLPPQHLPAVHRLDTFLQHIGISLFLCEFQPADIPKVHEAIEDNLSTQLDALTREVQTFDITQKPSVFRERLFAYEALRKKLTVYHETLGLATEHAGALLTVLEDKVQTMLTLREAIIVHKDGSIEPRTRATPETISALALPASW